MNLAQYGGEVNCFHRVAMAGHVRIGQGLTQNRLVPIDNPALTYAVLVQGIDNMLTQEAVAARHGCCCTTCGHHPFILPELHAIGPWLVFYRLIPPPCVSKLSATHRLQLYPPLP